jgi:polysaccharide biosynthesis transport protein
MNLQDYSEQVDFQKYWLILKRHWLPACCVWGTTIACAVGVALSAKPTYEAQGKLLFKKQSAASAFTVPSSGEGGNKTGVGELQTLGKDNTPLDTEAEVIRSTPVVRKAIAALGWKDEQGLPIMPEEFLKGLQVKTIRGTDILLLTYKSPDPKEAAAAVNQLIAIYIQENIRSNRTEATAAREFINKQLPSKEAAVRELESSLRRFEESNRIVDLEQEAKSTVTAITDLDSQLGKAKVQLDTVAARQAEVQRKAGVDPQQALALNALGQSPTIQRTVVELQKVQEQLAAKRAQFQEEAPGIVRLKEQESNLQTVLRQRAGMVLGDRLKAPDKVNYQIGQFQQDLFGSVVNLEVERLSLESQTVSIAKTLNAYQERATSLPILKQRQRDLNRQLNAAQSTYETLLKSYQQVQLAENQNVGNARIISSANLPDDSVSPNRKIFVIAGVVIGSLLYVITAFVMELRDPSVKTVKEIRGLFGYPVLRLIPLDKPAGMFSQLKRRSMPIVPVRDEPNSMISEAFRTLQTSLRFGDQAAQPQVIAVTSSVSGEGRSTVCANLALALAQLGKRVLLLDGDLRNPQQQRIWQINGAVSLSEVVSDRTKFRRAVEKITPTLDVLPVGSDGSDPLAILDSKSMQALVTDLKSDYDFVVMDTPPVLMVADALVLGKLANGLLMVARPGVIDTVSAQAAKDLLVQSGLPVLGLVVNGVQPNHEPESYFHHAKNYQNQPPNPPNSPRPSGDRSIPMNGRVEGSKIL